jgi:hypothetical protein
MERYRVKRISWYIVHSRLSDSDVWRYETEFKLLSSARKYIREQQKNRDKPSFRIIHEHIVKRQVPLVKPKPRKRNTFCY